MPMSIRTKVFADTFAMVTFSFVIGMLVEVGFSGMTLMQSFHSRLLAQPLNIMTARPYGIFRDWMMRLAGPLAKSQFGQSVVDVLAYILFQMPLYALVVYTTGVSFEVLVNACIGQVVAFVIMARPYGLYLVRCRDFFCGRAVAA